MARMVQVKMWEASDGSRWETKREAERVDAQERVRKLVELYAFADMTKDDIMNMLLDHQEEFRQALGPDTTPMVAEGS